MTRLLPLSIALTALSVIAPAADAQLIQFPKMQKAGEVPLGSPGQSARGSLLPLRGLEFGHLNAEIENSSDAACPSSYSMTGGVHSLGGLHSIIPLILGIVVARLPRHRFGSRLRLRVRAPSTIWAPHLASGSLEAQGPLHVACSVFHIPRVRSRTLSRLRQWIARRPADAFAITSRP